MSALHECLAGVVIEQLSYADFAKLAELLAGIKGRFIMSLNEHPDIYALFGGFAIETVSVHYSAGTKRQEAKEVLISN